MKLFKRLFRSVILNNSKASFKMGITWVSKKICIKYVSRENWEPLWPYKIYQFCSNLPTFSNNFPQNFEGAKINSNSSGIQKCLKFQVSPEKKNLCKTKWIVTKNSRLDVYYLRNWRCPFLNNCSSLKLKLLSVE